MKTNILLAVFGIVLALLVANAAAWYLLPAREGTEFGNIDEFRAALSSPRASDGNRKKDGSLPFAAVIVPNKDDHIIYTLKPNLNDNFTGVTVHTNSFGMRSPERPLAKAVGTYRIALVGDSFAFGWGVDEDKIFAKVIEDKLNESAGEGRKYEVLNFGVPGYSTFQEVALLKERGLSFNPDAVLVFLVHNDFEFPFFVRDESKPNGLVQSFSLGRIGQLMANPVQQEAKLVAQHLDPNSALAELDDLAKSKGVATFVTVNPRKDWREITNKLTVLKTRPSLKLLDIGDEFEAIVAKNNYTQQDLNLPGDPHPTALRHKIYGELMASRMHDLIAGDLH